MWLQGVPASDYLFYDAHEAVTVLLGQAIMGQIGGLGWMCIDGVRFSQQGLGLTISLKDMVTEG